MARGPTKTPGATIEASLKKLGKTPEDLAVATGSSAAVINGLIKGDKISPEWSVKLGRALGEKDKYFADLQLTSEIAAAVKKTGKIVKLRKALAKPGRKPAAKTAAKPGRKPAAKAAAPKAPGAKRGRKPKAP